MTHPDPEIQRAAEAFIPEFHAMARRYLWEYAGEPTLWEKFEAEVRTLIAFYFPPDVTFSAAVTVTTFSGDTIDMLITERGAVRVE